MKKKNEERKSEYAKQPPELFNESMLDGEVIRQTPNFLKKRPRPPWSAEISPLSFLRSILHCFLIVPFVAPLQQRIQAGKDIQNRSHHLDLKLLVLGLVELL